MFKYKLEYFVAITTISALSIIGTSLNPLINYFTIEFPHKQRISKIRSFSDQYHYNKFLEDLVSNDDFKKYFGDEDFLAVYNNLRINKNLTNLDYRLSSTFLLSFFRDDLSIPNSKKTKELVEELKKKKRKLEN